MCLFISISLQFFHVPGQLDDLIHKLGNAHVCAFGFQLFDQRHKGFQLPCASPNRRNTVCANQRIIKADLTLCGILLHAVDRGQADSPLRHINDPPHSQVISSVINGFQICKKILDLPSGIEIDAAHNPIGHIGYNQLFFKHTGLGIGTIENRKVMIASFS